MLRKLMSLLTASEEESWRTFERDVANTGLDALSVASILPFMGVLANPDLVRTNELLNLVFVTSQKFGITLLISSSWVLVLVFLLLIASLVFKAFGICANSLCADAGV